MTTPRWRSAITLLLRSPSHDRRGAALQVHEPALGALAISGHGGPASEATVRPTASKDGDGNAPQFSARVGIASDYIYRGTTLSDRKPALGAGFEATLRTFYAGATLTARCLDP